MAVWCAGEAVRYYDVVCCRSRWVLPCGVPEKPLGIAKWFTEEAAREGRAVYGEAARFGRVMR